MTTVDTRVRDLQLLELGKEATLEQIEVAYYQLHARYDHGCLASYGLLRVDERKRLLKALLDAYQRLIQAKPGGTHQGGVGGGFKTGKSAPKLTSFSSFSSGATHKTEINSLQSSSLSTSPLNESPSTRASFEPRREAKSLKQRHSMAQQMFFEVQDAHEEQNKNTVTFEPKPIEFHGEILQKLRLSKGLSLGDIAAKTSTNLTCLKQLEASEYCTFSSSKEVRILLDAYALVLDLKGDKVLSRYLIAYWASRSMNGGEV